MAEICELRLVSRRVAMEAGWKEKKEALRDIEVEWLMLVGWQAVVAGSTRLKCSLWQSSDVEAP